MTEASLFLTDGYYTFPIPALIYRGKIIWLKHEANPNVSKGLMQSIGGGHVELAKAYSQGIDIKDLHLAMINYEEQDERDELDEGYDSSPIFEEAVASGSIAMVKFVKRQGLDSEAWDLVSSLKDGLKMFKFLLGRRKRSLDVMSALWACIENHNEPGLKLLLPLAKRGNKQKLFSLAWENRAPRCCLTLMQKFPEIKNEHRTLNIFKYFLKI